MFELLLADMEQHFRALAQAPTEILRHIGSPFAPEKDQSSPPSHAQAVYKTMQKRVLDSLHRQMKRAREDIT
jgi:hypothetical protein